MVGIYRRIIFSNRLYLFIVALFSGIVCIYLSNYFLELPVFICRRIIFSNCLCLFIVELSIFMYDDNKVRVS